MRDPDPDPADPRPPAGELTFLFTDIVGSTALWEAHPEPMRSALARHDALLHHAIADGRGHVFKTVGDAFCAAFASAADALAAALAAQQALASESWPVPTPIRVRMALNAGRAEQRDNDYFGSVINRTARLLSAAHGGQVLLSRAAADGCALPPAASLRDLGTHRLKDLSQPEQVFELRHPALRSDCPPIRSLSTHPNNLPQQVTSFIGRQAQIADIERLIESNRLVTLTGSGGCGKTRLALHAAAESLARFPDGAWFVDLASLSDARLVDAMVAAVLGVAERAGQPAVQTIGEHIADHRMLLILDNCEHLIGACASLASALLDRCAGLRVIATSRAPLEAAGEQLYRVPSLSLVDEGSVLTPSALNASEAASLFFARASMAGVELAVDARAANSVASICRRLDGIPLAIELAAARCATLSVQEIDRRLEHRFALLARGPRTALARHRTLRALVDWSFDLLSDAERLLFARLAVFAGSFTLDAAEAICADDDAARRNLVEVLSSLVEKSLVITVPAEPPARYRLAETMREYARERLQERDEERSLRERHAGHYRDLAEDAAATLTGAQQAESLRRLQLDYENLRACLEWSLAADHRDLGLRVCAALQRFWATRGYLAEGRDWCDRVLRASESRASSTREYASVLNAAGLLAYYQGDFAAASSRFDQVRAIRERIGDRAGLAASFNNLGNVAIERGNYGTARSMHERSLALSRELNDEAGMANSLLNLGVVADRVGDHDSAIPAYEQSLAIRRRLGDRRGIALALNNLGDVAFAQGDYAASRAWHEDGLAIRRELEDRRGIALSLGNLARLAFEERDWARSRSLALESLHIAVELGDKRQIAYLLEGLGAIQASSGDLLHAARLWGAAASLREAIGVPDLPFGRTVGVTASSVRATQPDHGAFDRAWADGRAMPVEELIARTGSLAKPQGPPADAAAAR